MIPVTLNIKGLYSYQKEQTIDFTRLLEGQLFGIFGSVGSGKSTILEAISYALYGDTERLNKTNDNRNYNMMNLKSNELLIDFTFMNYDDQLYRFIVRGKRNSKQFDKVGTLERSAYKQVNGQWDPLESVSGEKVIGLSYDNFRRTIIIPQGKFQEFLQLGDSERTRMLKEIFQLEKYEFFYQTSSLEKKNNEEIQRLTGELAVFAEVNAESLAESKERLILLRNILEHSKAKLLQKEQQLKEQEGVKQLYVAFRKHELELEVLNSKKVYFDGVRKQISDFNYCVLHFREDLNKQEAFSQAIQKYSLQKEELTGQFNQTAENLQQIEKDLQYYKVEAEKLEYYKNRITDYDIAIKTLAFKKEIDNNALRIKNGEQQLELVTKERDTLKLSIQEKGAQLKLLKSKMPDFNVLMAVRSWFTTLKHELAIKLREEENLQRLSLKVKDLDVEFNRLIDNDLLNGYSPDIGAAKLKLQEQKLYLKSKLDEMQHTITHYEVQLKLSEFTSALHDGSACPLCGAVEHPNVLQIEDVNTYIDGAKVKVQELKQKDLAIDQLHSALESLEFKYKQLKEEITGVELQMRSANERVTNHYNKFEWSGFEKDNELLLEEKFNEAKDIKQQLEKAEHDLEALNLKYQNSEDRYQRFKVAIDKIQRDLDVKDAEVSLLRNQFNGQDYAVLIVKPSGELLQEKERLQAHIVKVQSEFNRITDLLQVNKQQYEVLKTKIETAQSHLNEVKRDFELLSAQIQEELERSDFEHIESVKKILEQQASVTSLESELKDYDFKLYSLQQKYIELKQELQGKTFDEAAYEALKGEYELLKQECQEKNDEFIREQHLIKQQELNLERKAALEKQIDQLQIRKDNISVLKNMFKGSGFVSYISAVYLNQLCASANERFYKLTHQQLRLEVTEKNDFQVRDFLNDGKLRSVKTLSGGQTFQASLSLALALAESVQQQNKSKQNFFFLDEGFGSLDKESLQVAFSTLKSLRKENRIVGVISHVEDLQQEIDVFLKVKNDAVEGSTIKGSWE